jgi:leader peptidase (prepilin peptidase)/N-methyltransferase
MSAAMPADHSGMLDSTTYMLLLVSLFGLVMGSAVTAIAYRVPRAISWLKGRSACPGCHTALGPLDLVPVLSFVLSRGRCRHCGARVSWRYPLTELWCAAWAVLLFLRTGPVAVYPLLAIWGFMLVALTWIDYDFKLLPDVLTFPGTLIALVVAMIRPHGIHDALIGLLVGSGSLWLIAWAYRRVRGMDGMGGGDIKLAAVFGVVLGGPLTFLTLFLAAIAGTLWALPLLLRGRAHARTELPFGTLLAPSAMIVLLWGDRALHAYLSLLHRG